MAAFDPAPAFCVDSKRTPYTLSDKSEATLGSTTYGSSIFTPGSLNQSSFIAHGSHHVRTKPGSHSTMTAISPGSSSYSTGRISHHFSGTKSSHSSVSSLTPRSGSYSAASTPASGARSSKLFQSSAIVSIVEGRGVARGEIGMAYIDLKRAVLLLSQFPDSQTYVKVLTKLMMIQPIEIILPNTVCDGSTKAKLFQLLAEEFGESTLSTVQRKYFNENKGIEYIHHLCASDFSSVEVEIANKYYCLAAAAALIKYIEFVQNVVYAPKSLRVCFKGSELTAMIDMTTVKNLELLTNARDPTSTHSLYGILNYTKTVGGARLLRSNILEPPCSNETIQLRQNCLKELAENEDMFYGLEAVLKRFLDIDHLISLIVTVPKRDTQRTAEATITNVSNRKIADGVASIVQVIHLKHVLQLVEPLQSAIKGTNNKLLNAFCQVLDDPGFKSITSAIEAVVHDDTQFQKGSLYMRAQKCFCIKSGLNPMLDISRQLYTEVIDDISALTKQLSEKHSLSVKSAFSASRGFYLQVYIRDTQSEADTPNEQELGSNMRMEDLPGEFLKVTKQRHTFSFTTLDLIKLNTRANDSLDEIYTLSHSVLKEMLSGIIVHVGCLYRLAESVAMLDMLHSFTHLCTISDYTCPEFTDTLALKQGRHPILDKIAFDPPVPNNTYASSGSNFMIITGPNMSGKSTYLRQIALLQIMAQIGCYIPAEYGSFRLADRIYSRIGSDDDIETNASTFMVEMREISYILQNVSESSLIIIDELGRGTSAEEGMGLCYAICEQLLTTGAFTFLATHFLELNNLLNCYPNVEVYHFQLKILSDVTRDTDPNTHQLVKGVMKQTNYGLELAKMSSLPDQVLEEASTIASHLSKQKLVGHLQSEGTSTSEGAVHKIGMQLVQVARNSLLDMNGLRSYLRYLKSKWCKEDSNLQLEM